jgi:hypothetical protein
MFTVSLEKVGDTTDRVELVVGDGEIVNLTIATPAQELTTDEQLERFTNNDLEAELRRRKELRR